MKENWPKKSKCAICDSFFLRFPTTAKQRYCSVECKRLGHCRRVAKYRKNNPDIIKKRQRYYNKKNSIIRAENRMKIKELKIVEMKKELSRL